MQNLATVCVFSLIQQFAFFIMLRLFTLSCQKYSGVIALKPYTTTIEYFFKGAPFHTLIFIKGATLFFTCPGEIPMADLIVRKRNRLTDKEIEELFLAKNTPNSLHRKFGVSTKRATLLYKEFLKNHPLASSLNKCKGYTVPLKFQTLHQAEYSKRINNKRVESNHDKDLSLVAMQIILSPMFTWKNKTVNRNLWKLWDFVNSLRDDKR